MMKTCMFCIALWMLAYVVNAEMNNFADTVTTPHITTPKIEMASRRPSGGAGGFGERADAVGGAFHQLAQGLLRVQDALRLQELQAERRAQEGLRLQETRAETALQDTVRHMEQKIRDRDQAIQSLREECSSSIERLEKKVDQMGKQFVASTKSEGDAAVGGHESITQMESRMDTLEAKLKEALEGLFPNMEALLEHLKRFSFSEDSRAVPTNPTVPSNFSSILPSSSASTSTSTTSSSLSSLSPNAPLSTSASRTHFASTNVSISSFPFPSIPTSTSTSVSVPHVSFSLSASTSPFPSSSHSPSQSLAPTTSSNSPVSIPPSTSSSSASTSPRPPALRDEERERQQAEVRAREAKERKRVAPSFLENQLIQAAGNRNLEEVRRLLDSGVHVNYTYVDGWSPLRRASSEDEHNAAVVSLLIERGADVNAVDGSGWSALHYAAWYDRSGRNALLLLGAGADVDARTVDGKTPLHFAAFKNNEATVRALLANGADKSLRPWKGKDRNKTPFDMSTSDAIRNLLRT